jgi:phenylacetate-CoA ligase
MHILSLPEGFNNSDWLANELQHRSEAQWERLGQERALLLFHAMATRVPAYKSFLKKQHINHEHIRNIKDFKTLPTIDKDNYLRVYDRADLCWDGDFKNQQWIVSTTSGSTGKPYYFPRQEAQDRQYAISAEMYLRTNFDIQNKSTLYIVAFPMGAWIGGLFTYEALKIIADKKQYKLSIITPGIHKREVIEAVKQLGKDFDQVIIGSYAPFLKDILDDGVREGLNWSDYNLGFVFSAEAFSEVFRDYVIKKTGLKDPYRSTLNHY